MIKITKIEAVTETLRDARVLNTLLTTKKLQNNKNIYNCGDLLYEIQVDIAHNGKNDK